MARSEEVRIEDAVSKLFHAFGMVSVERVVAFCEAITDDCKCAICIIGTCKHLAKTAPRMVTPLAFITAYRDFTDRHHITHTGQGVRVDEAAVAEAFWRKDAPKPIREAYGCSPRIALLIAADMWASTTIPADVRAVAEECSATRIWLDVVVGEPSEALLESSFDLARAIATKDPAEYSDGEWETLTLYRQLLPNQERA